MRQENQRSMRHLPPLAECACGFRGELVFAELDVEGPQATYCWWVECAAAEGCEEQGVLCDGPLSACDSWNNGHRRRR